MIDKVIVLTMDHSVERQWLWYGASRMMGIPAELVFYVSGHSGRSFSSMESVAQAAAEDGFDFVHEYAIGESNDFAKQTKGSVAQVWNLARIFRWIAQSGETCLVIYDDKMISVDFLVLLSLVEELVADGVFRVFQLGLRGDLNEFEYEAMDRFEEREFTQQVFSAVFHKQLTSYKDFFVRHGLAGYEETMVVSPGGAEWILDRLDNASDFHLFFDSFVADELAVRSRKMVVEGTWCPARFGFDFVQTICAMETQTNWAPEGSLHHEESKAQESFQWLM